MIGWEGNKSWSNGNYFLYQWQTWEQNQVLGLSFWCSSRLTCIPQTSHGSEPTTAKYSHKRRCFLIDFSLILPVCSLDVLIVLDMLSEMWLDDFRYTVNIKDMSGLERQIGQQGGYWPCTWLSSINSWYPKGSQELSWTELELSPEPQQMQFPKSKNLSN